MLRAATGPYKYNRSTLKQAGMVKLKRFKESEAVIVGFYELERNANEAIKDDRGLTTRSSHQSGMVKAGTLGGVICRDIVTGVEFRCGSGFDQSQRGHIWANQELYLGRLFTYRHMPYGQKEKPRQPVWRRWRAADDLSRPA
jgi:DNA ligase-1